METKPYGIVCSNNHETDLYRLTDKFYVSKHYSWDWINKQTLSSLPSNSDCKTKVQDTNISHKLEAELWNQIW